MNKIINNTKHRITIRNKEGGISLDYLEDENYKNYAANLVDEVSAFEYKDPGF
jgi:hypothetical protein